MALTNGSNLSSYCCPLRGKTTGQSQIKDAIRTTVSCFNIAVDEAYHCCVIRKLNDAVEIYRCSAVVCQRCEQEWTEYTALRSASTQCGGAGGVAAKLDR